MVYNSERQLAKASMQVDIEEVILKGFFLCVGFLAQLLLIAAIH